MKPENKYISVTDWIVFFVSTLLIFLSSILLLVSGLIIALFNLFKRKPFLVSSIIILLAILFIAVRWFVIPIPWNVKENSVYVVIEEGDNMAKIVERLKEKNLIGNGKWFLILSEVLEKDRYIQAGRYNFEKGSTLYSIFKKLVKGEVTYVDVVIPEGLTVREISGILKRGIGIDSIQFVKICTDSQFAKNLDIPASDLEGYLFPNTYKLSWGMKPPKLAQMMVNEFKKTFDSSLASKGNQLFLA